MNSLGLCNGHYFLARRAKDKRVCELPLCLNKLYSQGMCSTHYRKWRQYGDPNWKPASKSRRPKERCTFEDCPNPQFGRGLCSTHLSRWHQGLRLDLPLTPGKRGRKPSIPGIPDEVRAGVSRAHRAYAAGLTPRPQDMAMEREYARLVKEYRRSQPGWKQKWANAAKPRQDSVPRT